MLITVIAQIVNNVGIGESCIKTEKVSTWTICLNACVCGRSKILSKSSDISRKTN